MHPEYLRTRIEELTRLAYGADPEFKNISKLRTRSCVLGFLDPVLDRGHILRKEAIACQGEQARKQQQLVNCYNNLY